MADVKIRGLDDGAYRHFKARAARAGHSVSEELRRALLEAARKPRAEFNERTARRLERLYRKYGIMEDSAPGIRAARDRDER